MLVIFYVFLSFLLAFLFAELVGYVLHMLLHSQRIEFLSRNHMLHHLVAYSPKQTQRPDAGYVNSTENRSNFLGFGMEWIAPLGLVMLLVWGVAYLLRIQLMYTTIFTFGSVVWGYFLFGYMHGNMHLKNFWMEKNPITKNWFLRIRKLHDVHHMHIDDEGKMAVNYGICFFFFDRIFNSYQRDFKKFNHKGYEVALKKYDFINR